MRPRGVTLVDEGHVAPSIIIDVVAAAIVNVGHSCGRCHHQHRPSSWPLPSSTSMWAGAIASPSRTMRGRSKRPRGTTLVGHEGRAVVDGNVGVEYVIFLMVMHPTFIYIFTIHIHPHPCQHPLQLHSPPKCPQIAVLWQSSQAIPPHSIGSIIVLFVTLIWGSSKMRTSNPFNTALLLSWQVL